ncbi:hypothetical protein O6H91_07G121600 [Diphasiastrum complanatum]|uniref:Uncharacterized protein n=2 Tax=Diphasiastrum complanatum TaxID=34168 RepID=A0ACC2D9G5_DIPCM|nr:hypothetical protein O6H91_07G121600 [Diphasiastrum complanatum]
MASTEIGSSSHPLPPDLFMDQCTATNASDEKQLPSVGGVGAPPTGSATMGLCGQVTESVQGVPVEQGFLSEFISSDDCDPNDLDSSFAGIRSFQDLLNFGVLDYENREHGFGETAGGTNAPVQDGCIDGSHSMTASGSADVCGDGAAGGQAREQFEGARAKAATEGWQGRRYGSKGASGEQKPEQKQSVQGHAYPVYEGSTVSDVGLSSGSSSLDRRSTVIHLNTKSESSSGLEYESGIPSSIPKSDQKEHDSTKRETGVPIWVKWRGKWQACIQCSINDCSAATMKAMPTYSKKSYVVAYFPASRMHSWIDTQHVCAISENPEPLAGGSHESARESVKDVDMARHAMLRTLAATMCDVSDRLPIKAVIETAQDAGVWKSFAKEAVESRDYSDIGKLLVRFYGMIMRKYLKSSWVNNSFGRWKSDCENSESASSIEKLNQELINAILWEEVASLWDKPEQSTLGSEWKDWKGAVSEGCALVVGGGKGANLKTVTTLGPADSVLQSSPNGSLTKRRKEPPTQQTWPCDNGVNGAKFELSRKRSKLEIRRRVSYPVSDAELASGGHDQPVSADGSTSQSAPMTSLPAEQSQIETQKDDIVCSPYINQDRGINNLKRSLGNVDNPSTVASRGSPLTTTPHGVPENTNEASEHSFKSNHLLEQPRGDGVSLMSPGISLPRTSFESRDICRAMTKYGRRCAFKVKKGSIHCKRHSIQNDAICSVADDVGLGDGEKRLTQAIEICPENVEPGALSFLTTSSGPGSLATSIERKPSNWRRCIGWCKRNGEQCSHRAKVGMLHCKKHLWLAKISGDSSPQRCQLQENPSNVAEEKLLRSKFMLDNYMKIALNDKGDRDEVWQKSKKKSTDKILAEASQDMVVANILLRFVVQQKKNLEVAIGIRSSNDVSNFEAISGTGSFQEHEHAYPIVTDELKTLEKSMSDSVCLTVGVLDQHSKNCDKQADKLRCSICIEEFMELITLGSHWKTSHYKEAQCFLKGYICRVCGQELASKPAIERHWKAQHEDVLETPAMPICMVCDQSFSNFDSLWEHVVSVHSDHLSGASSLSAIPGTSRDGSHVTCNATAKECADPCQGNGQVSLTNASSVNLSLEHIPFKVEGDILKFKCKFCGQRFRLLPDLGRHHQAEHMNSGVPGFQTQKRKHREPSSSNPQKAELSEMVLLAPPGCPSAAGRWKRRGRVVKDGLSSLLRIKAAVQSLKEQNLTKNTNEGVCERTISPTYGHGLLGTGQLPWKGPTLTGVPGDDDILSAATSVCCVLHLCNVLGKKYETLPQEFPQKALELCRRAMLAVSWIGEGFVCPNGCKVYLKVPDLAVTFNATPTCKVSGVDTTEVKSQYLTEKSSSDAFPVTSAPESTVQVICKDVSLGQESIPISCVVDEDIIKACSCSSCKEGKISQVDASSPWETFSYITRRLLKPSLGLDTKNSQLGCSCKESKCYPESCDHVLLFDSDNNDACDIYGQPMHGRFPYNTSGQIILQEGYLVYECNSSCHCQEECTNRVLQKGVQVKLEIFKTCHKGWAVRTAQHIHRGTFVCEYLGEVLNDAEANKRGERYDTIGCSYLYDIDVHLDTSASRRGAKPFVIDATKFGNVSRFINHSCAPNLINYQVLVESMDCQLAHIGLYASRDIAIGEELAYDYRYKLLPGKGCPCHCGAASCRGRLY